MSGLSPFVGADDFETMTNVSLGKYSFDYAPFEDISSQAKDFVENLLMKEPAKRLTAKNALNHEWLHCTKGNSEREITLSLTKTKLKRYVILRRFVQIPTIVRTLDIFLHVFSHFSWRKAALSIMFLNKLNKMNTGHAISA